VQNSATNWSGNSRWSLGRAFSNVTGWLNGSPPLEAREIHKPAQPRAYVVRKRGLPHEFGERDWRRCLDYWGHKCAVCERPRGLWHTLAADHWIPLTASECPGTVPTNIVPLCHGEGGCNNSKGKKSPGEWLEARLGPQAAFQKQLQIDAYFLWVKDLLTERLGCPKCGEPVLYAAQDDIWLCTYCDAEWTSDDARGFRQCPNCMCWMVESVVMDEMGEMHEVHHCPRCAVTRHTSELPPPETCAGCGEGHLVWTYEPDGPSCGFWVCTACRGEWVFVAE
jgi:ribosomal protein S27AE